MVERISIDEAFLDVGGAIRLFGPPATIAAHIRRRVRDEVGLAVSIGVARTKHLANLTPHQVAQVPNGARALPGILTALEAEGIEVASVRVARPSLDQVYLHFAGRSLAAGPTQDVAA